MFLKGGGRRVKVSVSHSAPSGTQSGDETAPNGAVLSPKSLRRARNQIQRRKSKLNIIVSLFDLLLFSNSFFSYYVHFLLYIFSEAHGHTFILFLNVDQIFYQIFGQIFGQVFGPEYSVQYYWGGQNTVYSATRTEKYTTPSYF